MIAELFLDDLVVLDGVGRDFFHLHAWESADFGFHIHIEDHAEAVLTDEGAFDFAIMHGDFGLPFFVFCDEFFAGVKDAAVAFDAGPTLCEVLVPDFGIVLHEILSMDLAVGDEVVGDLGDGACGCGHGLLLLMGWLVG